MLEVASAYLDFVDHLLEQGFWADTACHCWCVPDSRTMELIRAVRGNTSSRLRGAGMLAVGAQLPLAERAANVRELEDRGVCLVRGIP